MGRSFSRIVRSRSNWTKRSYGMVFRFKTLRRGACAAAAYPTFRGYAGIHRDEKLRQRGSGWQQAHDPGRHRISKPLDNLIRNVAWMNKEKVWRDLLLALVRDQAGAGSIRGLAERVTAWDELIDQALQHRVLPMVVANLEEMGSAVPAMAVERIRRENDRIIVGNLANAAELIAVLQRFDQEGIQAMPFKGVALAASVYGDLHGRPGGDLDLLIHARDLERAMELIRERGYELETADKANAAEGSPWNFERHFVRPSDGMVLELRWQLDLFRNRFGRNLGLSWVWRGRRVVLLAGARIPAIGPEISFILLCMHGCKHLWSRLIWVCDVKKLIASTPDLNWENVMVEAQRQGLRRPVMLGSLLAERICAAAIPPEIRRACEADSTVRSIADHFTKNLVENPGVGPRGRIPLGMQLLDAQDRWKFFLSSDFWRSSSRDRELMGLPNWIRPLYFLLRPMRLLWDRSAR